jgi:hypothetical protein
MTLNENQIGQIMTNTSSGKDTDIIIDFKEVTLSGS